MGIGKVIFIPILLMTLIIGTVYFSAFTLESTEEARVTEISHSLEANFNEIVRQNLVEHLDKKAMQEGFLYVSNTAALRNDILHDLRSYISNNYVHNGELYLDLGKTLKRDVNGGFNTVNISYGDTNENINMIGLDVIIDINPGRNPNGMTNIADNYGTARGIAGRAYKSQYSDGSSVSDDNFPSVTISSNNDLTLRYNRNGTDQVTTLNHIDSDGNGRIVGYFTSFMQNTGGTNMYPVSFTCHVSAESYSDSIKGKGLNSSSSESDYNRYQTNKDNRAKSANTAYVVRNTTDTGTATNEKTNTYNAGRTEAIGSNRHGASSAQVSFAEGFADKESMNTDSGVNGGGFAVGLDLDKNATISGGKIAASQVTSNNKASNAINTTPTW